jgi:hypothetical protein
VRIDGEAGQVGHGRRGRDAVLIAHGDSLGGHRRGRDRPGSAGRPLVLVTKISRLVGAMVTTISRPWGVVGRRRPRRRASLVVPARWREAAVEAACWLGAWQPPGGGPGGRASQGRLRGVLRVDLLAALCDGGCGLDEMDECFA